MLLELDDKFKISKKIEPIKFFKNPCVACIHFEWDGEYETGCYPECMKSYDDDILNVEAPAKCIRKGYFYSKNLNWIGENKFYDVLIDKSHNERVTNDLSWGMLANRVADFEIDMYKFGLSLKAK